MEKEITPNSELKIVEIKPIGSYFDIDSEGYVVNPASKEKLQEKWKPAIDDAIEVYKKQYGDTLRNVYVRGSVAKGQAIDGISDVDTFAYVDLEKSEINNNFKEAKEHILQKYPFVEGVELEAQPLAHSKEDTILLTQSLCIYGEPLEVPKLKPGKEMALHAPRIVQRQEWMKAVLKSIEEDTSEEQVKEGCKWRMKILLRVGAELTMERSGKYTRDLYPCYQLFSEYYPKKEPEMREVLYLVLNPTSDKEKIKAIVSNLGGWLVEEAKKYFN